MSQIKLLLDVVSDMRHLADSLAEYANAVTTNEHIACEKFSDLKAEVYPAMLAELEAMM